jgi:hypothetical protein
MTITVTMRSGRVVSPQSIPSVIARHPKVEYAYDQGTTQHQQKICKCAEEL